MKKNIEWLKKEIATEMIELEPNRKERWSDVKYQTLRSVAQKIYELDEPEVLSQEESINIVLDDLKEYIKEQQSLSQNVGLAHTSAGNDTHYRQYDYVLECINEYEPSDELQNLIIPKQEVLSQEWIDYNKFVVTDEDGDDYAVVGHATLRNLLVPKQEELESKIKVLIEVYKQEEDAYGELENGWISGFIKDLKNLVEEEQKYTVSSPKEASGFWFLSKNKDGEVVIGTNKDYFDYGWDALKLTEQEIKDYDERYWPFAVPVEVAE